MTCNLLQRMKTQRKNDALDMKDIKGVLVELRGMVLRRESELRTQISMLRKEILVYLPLDSLKGSETLFTCHVCQQVMMESIQRALLRAGIYEPDETDISLMTLDLLFSGYLRAHMYVGDKPQRG